MTREIDGQPGGQHIRQGDSRGPLMLALPKLQLDHLVGHGGQAPFHVWQRALTDGFTPVDDLGCRSLRVLRR